MAHLRIVYKEIVIDTEIVETTHSYYTESQAFWLARVQKIFDNALELIARYEGGEGK